MASDGEDTLKGAGRRDLSEGTHEPRECMACRGTGRLISQLGGTESAVSCPWCEGSGLRLAEIDAQAHWGTQRGQAPAGEGADAEGSPQRDTDAPDPASQDSAPQAPAADAGHDGPAAA